MNIAQYIDHTYLKADGTEEIIIRLCNEAREHNFKAVCINPCWIKVAKKSLVDTSVKIATVVGFPLGATSTAAKVAETKQAVTDGADEIDMVIAIGLLKSGYYDRALEDIRAVVEAARPKATVKAIIETALLSDEEKIKACQAVKEANAHFVKTSTGFAQTGATLKDVQLMRKVVGPDMGIKAAGGIRTYDDARAMIAAGATRIGASSGIQIVEQEKEATS